MAGLIKINVRADVRRITQGLDNLAMRQVPFATAQALNSLAADVVKAESAHIAEVFPSATPFTKRSVRYWRARKDRLDAVVYLGDIAARYLAPYIDGGRHFLSGRALLNPKAVNTNAYGNLPKSTIARLKGRADIFIGGVKAKGGQEIRGVWQRVVVKQPKSSGAALVARLGKGARRAVAKAMPAQARTKLKLLIRFGDALPVEQHLDWGDTAQEIVDKGFNRAFAIAFARALATAKD